MSKQRECVPANSLPTPEAFTLATLSPKLRDAAGAAARAYGLYLGANQAIKDAVQKGSDASSMADEFRQQCVLMCIVRSFALLDRATDTSFQGVYRALKVDGSLEALAALYAAAPPASTMEASTMTCAAAVAEYQRVYSTINWKTLGKLQSFRNHAIAHISWSEVRHFVTYGELRTLVVICCDLATQLDMMTSGLNSHSIKKLEVAELESFHFWSTTIAADLDPFQMPAGL